MLRIDFINTNSLSNSHTSLGFFSRFSVNSNDDTMPPLSSYESTDTTFDWRTMDLTSNDSEDDEGALPRPLEAANVPWTSTPKRKRPEDEDDSP